MKFELIFIVLSLTIVFLSNTVYAGDCPVRSICAAKTTLQEETYCRRFVDINQTESLGVSNIHIDLGEVVGIVLDRTGNITRTGSPNKWVVILRNGKMLEDIALSQIK